MISNDEWLQQWRNAGQVTIQTSRDPRAKPLLEACLTGDGVEIVYYGGSTPGESRVICPRRLFKVKGYDSVYVEAYCHTRGEDRNFRLDKIELVYRTHTTSPAYAPRTTATTQGEVRSRPSTGCLVYVIAAILSVLILLAIVFGAIGT